MVGRQADVLVFISLSIVCFVLHCIFLCLYLLVFIVVHQTLVWNILNPTCPLQDFILTL